MILGKTNCTGLANPGMMVLDRFRGKGYEEAEDYVTWNERKMGDVLYHFTTASSPTPNTNTVGTQYSDLETPEAFDTEYNPLATYFHTVQDPFRYQALDRSGYAAANVGRSRGVLTVGALALVTRTYVFTLQDAEPEVIEGTTILVSVQQPSSKWYVVRLTETSETSGSLTLGLGAITVANSVWQAAPITSAPLNFTATQNTAAVIDIAQYVKDYLDNAKTRPIAGIYYYLMPDLANAPELQEQEEYLDWMIRLFQTTCSDNRVWNENVGGAWLLIGTVITKRLDYVATLASEGIEWSLSSGNFTLGQFSRAPGALRPAKA